LIASCRQCNEARIWRKSLYCPHRRGRGIMAPSIIVAIVVVVVAIIVLAKWVRIVP
jgi:hypothetical protein